MKRVLAIVLFLGAFGILAGPAYANREGHGGRIWKCTDTSDPHHMKLLDYALVDDGVWDLKLDFGGGKTEAEIINTFMDRLARVEPSRAAIYREKALHFMEPTNAQPWGNEVYMNMNDVEMPVKKPATCEPMQVFFQNNGDTNFADFPNVKFRYVAPLWNAMSVEQRAGMILHEVIYEDALMQDQVYADNAMRMNATIASTWITTAQPEQWRAFLGETKLGYHYLNWLLEPSSVKSDAPTQAFLKWTKSPDENNRVVNGAVLRFRPRNLSIPSEKIAKYDISFYPNGEVEYAILATKHTPIIMGSPSLSLSFKIAAAGLSFYPNGALRSAYLTGLYNKDLPEWTDQSETAEGRSWVMAEGQQVWLEPLTLITFSPEGTPQLVSVDEPYATISRQGKKIEVRGMATLNPDGNFVSVLASGGIKLRMADGRKQKFVKDEPVFFLANGDIAAGGVYSYGGIEQDRFVKIATAQTAEGRFVGFRYCSIVSPSQCEQIGEHPFYGRKDLKKGLKLKEETLLAYDGDSQARTAKHLVLSGLLGGLGSIITGASIGGHAGSVLIVLGGYGMVASLYAGPLAAAAVGFYEDATKHKRTIDRILNEHYLAIHTPIEEFREELVNALKTIPAPPLKATVTP